ncbi:hypothetical protein M9194_20095 [Vibrio sp. S4M6]|uniref:type III secretion system domain-containing protein n=1 Tax=Vibrio sinus TaxID=2946865 RepID=UPI00202A27DC|nr:type III secretion system domain-containing protein [Vibrio sinus]MCL9783730.1 hypothetical protein [Vibrio sinus]
MKIDKAVSNYYQLAYCPGKSMCVSWWDELHLSKWKDIYPHLPQCQKAIDALVQKRRGFPASVIALPEEDWQLELCRDINRLQKLLIALGLIRLARQDYLLLRRFRESLLTYFQYDELIQLQGIYPDAHFIDEKIKVNAEPVREKELPQLALFLGWTGMYQESAFWNVLAILFPARYVAAPLNKDAQASLKQWFIRLQRWL